MIGRLDPFLALAPIAAYEQPAAANDCVSAAALAHAQATIAGASQEEAVASAVAAFAARIPSGRSSGKKGRRVKRAIESALADHGFAPAPGAPHLMQRRP